MQLTLVMIGKNKESFVEEGFNHFIKRIKKYVSFQTKEVPGLKKSKNLSAEEIKREEGVRLLKHIPKGSEIVLLDERGSRMSSEKFAKWVEKKMTHGGQSMCFIIGGAYGFSEEVYKKASFKLSLSDMTFSHQLIRIIFAEQLYRALTIIKGEPYHHGK